MAVEAFYVVNASHSLRQAAKLGSRVLDCCGDFAACRKFQDVTRRSGDMTYRTPSTGALVQCLFIQI